MAAVAKSITPKVTPRPIPTLLLVFDTAEIGVVVFDTAEIGVEVLVVVTVNIAVALAA
jgi:hypothetical protein